MCLRKFERIEHPKKEPDSRGAEGKLTFSWVTGKDNMGRFGIKESIPATPEKFGSETPELYVSKEFDEETLFKGTMDSATEG
jgi:hypothetical protein